MWFEFFQKVSMARFSPCPDMPPIRTFNVPMNGVFPSRPLGIDYNLFAFYCQVLVPGNDHNSSSVVLIFNKRPFLRMVSSILFCFSSDHSTPLDNHVLYAARTAANISSSLLQEARIFSDFFGPTPSIP